MGFFVGAEVGDVVGESVGEVVGGGGVAAGSLVSTGDSVISSGSSSKGADVGVCPVTTLISISMIANTIVVLSFPLPPLVVLNLSNFPTGNADNNC